MQVRTRRRLLAAVVVLALLGAAVVGYALLPTRTRTLPNPSLPAVGSPEMARLVEAGRYVALSADCVACHSPAHGQPFSGGLPLASPIGQIYSTNITPDPTHGIGRYSLDEFDRAIRHGIARDGRTLYPAMPYPSYARLSDADLKALYAYMLHGVAPAGQPNRDNGIAWPLSMRWPLAIWRKVWGGGLTDGPPSFTAARYGGDAAAARGAYLVQAAGHCGACHTPRALTFQEEALDDRSPDFLAGGQVIDGWFAVDLRGDAADGLGRWTIDDIAATLRGARNAHQAVVGGAMQDVVVHSTQWLADDDRTAIATYLKQLPAGDHPAASYVPDGSTARAFRTGHDDSRGAQLYLDNCVACHRSDGLGQTDVFPGIAGNPTVLARQPTTLIRLVLAGSSLPGTRTAPSPLGMPSFAGRLSDDEAAQLLTFVRQSWGNQATAVTDAAVASVRSQLKDEARKMPAVTAQGDRRSAGAPDQR